MGAAATDSVTKHHGGQEHPAHRLLMAPTLPLLRTLIAKQSTDRSVARFLELFLAALLLLKGVDRFEKAKTTVLDGLYILVLFVTCLLV